MSDVVVPVVDAALLQKYDIAGPRYTSYPTAPQFHEKFTSQDLRAEIERTNAIADAPPISLYFHLPFCESVCFFCGCNVTFTSDRSRPQGYTQDLFREMDSVAPMIAKGRKVTQLHWGGGTPTFFSPDQLELLFEAIGQRFRFESDAEIGLEVDPRETTSEHLKVLRKVGFNRLSMGVQDFDPQVQQAVNRLQPLSMTQQTVEEARELGFPSISIDLIYGLPFQTEESFTRTLEQVLKLNPDRIALFNFAYLPEMIRHQKAIDSTALPSAEVKVAILRQAIAYFTQAGYRFVGMDHFAKPEDDLCRAQDAGTLYRNFQGYTTHAGCDLYAFGVSAIGQIGRVYAQNYKKIQDYSQKIAQAGFATMRGIVLSDDDVVRREVVMRLMCDFALDTKKIGQQFGIEFDSYFAEALEKLKGMEQDGLIEWEGKKLIVMPIGRLLVRNVCMNFDAYLTNPVKKSFSRTI